MTDQPPSLQCLFIPVNAVFGPHPPLELETIDQTPEAGVAGALREMIGFHFQVIRGPRGSCMYLHEEGKLVGLGENIVATFVARETGLSMADWIAGAVVVVGKPDDDGYDTSVPDKFLTYIESLGCRVNRGT